METPINTQAVHSQLKTAVSSAAKDLHKNVHLKVLIGFRKGTELKEHRAPHPSKLTVVEGKVIYKGGDAYTSMGQYNEMKVPVNKTRAVAASEDSLCLLTQG